MIYVNHDLKSIYVHIPKCGGCYVRDILINYYGFKQALPHKKKLILTKFFENPLHYENSNGVITTIRKYGIVRYFQTPYSDSDVYRPEDSDNYVIKSIIQNIVKTIANPNSKSNLEEVQLPTQSQHNIIGLFENYKKNISSQLENMRANENERYVHLSDEQWTEYYKFTFVRCPYAKLHSSYLNCKLKKFPDCEPSYYKDFNEFITLRNKIGNEAWFHSYITQIDHLIDFSGNIHLNYIGRVETLDDDLLCILNQIGITEIKHWKNIESERILNKSKRDKPFYEYYNEASFQFVNEWFTKDFWTFHLKKFRTLMEMQYYYKKSNDELVKHSAELHKRFMLFKIYKTVNLISQIENLENQHQNFIDNLKIIHKIKSNDVYFNDVTSKICDTIENIKREALEHKSFINIAAKYEKCSAFKKSKLKCKTCGYITENSLANKAHSNICKNLRQTVN
jgi:hypothetical protein